MSSQSDQELNDSLKKSAINKAIDLYCEGHGIDEIAERLTTQPEIIRGWAGEACWVERVKSLRVERAVQNQVLYEVLRNKAAKEAIAMLIGEGAYATAPIQARMALAAKILYSRIAEFEVQEEVVVAIDFTPEQLRERVNQTYGIYPSEPDENE